MKIGEFAKVNNTSIDTIRHYMDMGLIVAGKQGAQYNFDKQSQNSLDDIVALKSMGFSLSDIKTIFLVKSLGRLTNYQQMEYYRTLFESKHMQITQQMNELSDMKSKLESEMNALKENKHTKNFNMGVDVFALPLLRCTKCNGSLQVTDGMINDNQIMSGLLTCKCGMQYTVENGIIFTGSDYKEQDSFSTEYIVDYIKETADRYIDNVYKNIEYFNNTIDTAALKNKVVLDLGSGMGFLLRNIYADLPDTCLYIAVDHDINRHLFLKGMLERADVKKNVIFICGDFLNIPLKKKSVDMLMDFSGSSNYGFYHENFLLNEVDDLVKQQAHIAASYIIFKNFSADSFITDNLKHNYVLDNIKSYLTKLNYTPIYEKSSDYLTAGGKYENYFVKGEKVFSHFFYGVRNP